MFEELCRDLLGAFLVCMALYIGVPGAMMVIEALKTKTGDMPAVLIAFLGLCMVALAVFFVWLLFKI